MLRNRLAMAGVLVATMAGVAILLGLPSVLKAPERSPTPSPSISAGRGDPPAEVDGLPVLSLTAALSKRDAGSPDRIAVFGWAVRFFVPCPQPPDAYRPLESCVYRFTWLMAAPEQLSVTNADGSGSIHAPVGPAVNTTFDPPDPAVPQAVIVIGRFNDPRSGQCPAGSRRIACAQLFVADGVAWLGPIASPITSPITGPSFQPSGAA